MDASDPSNPTRDLASRGPSTYGLLRRPCGAPRNDEKAVAASPPAAGPQPVGARYPLGGDDARRRAQAPLVMHPEVRGPARADAAIAGRYRPLQLHLPD